MTKSKKMGAELVGRAFRCDDGVVRWVFAQTESTRNLHIRWLDEESNVWHWGGMRHPSKWRNSVDRPLDEVNAPQMGDVYALCNPLGGITRYCMGEGLHAIVR